ncbi:MAG: BrnT family toxin [Bacteriovoracales bacterium]|nr:BrnT family toxin [Bacteriovoracales bacterium]
MVRFEWDENKNKSNIKKHKVSFQEAMSVFYDSKAYIASDPEHSDDEERFIIIGFSMRLNSLIVCFCEREIGRVIRIFSARKLTKKEKLQMKKMRSL